MERMTVEEREGEDGCSMFIGPLPDIGLMGEEVRVCNAWLRLQIAENKHVTNRWRQQGSKAQKQQAQASKQPLWGSNAGQDVAPRSGHE